jgi:pyruvate dehydrogenase E1 component alpha subunit
LSFFGDGAASTGAFHESMILAVLFQVPVVFICENNQYAMGTPLERTSPIKDLSKKAEGYGMEGDRFEGHDVELVQERIGAAVERARSGDGPTFIEIQTYRFRGHSMSDPAKYRSRTELEQRKQKDPIVVLRERLLSLGVEESVLDDIDLAVDEETDAAVRFAEESEPAKHEMMMSTVLAPEGES